MLLLIFCFRSPSSYPASLLSHHLLLPYHGCLAASMKIWYPVTMTCLPAQKPSVFMLVYSICCFPEIAREHVIFPSAFGTMDATCFIHNLSKEYKGEENREKPSLSATQKWYVSIVGRTEPFSDDIVDRMYPCMPACYAFYQTSVVVYAHPLNLQRASCRHKRSLGSILEVH